MEGLSTEPPVTREVIGLPHGTHYDGIPYCYRRHDASVSAAHAADGRRFAEERAFFEETADRMAARGWPRAARAARRHFSSRLNALTRLPAAARHGGLGGVRALARHAFGT